MFQSADPAAADARILVVEDEDKIASSLRQGLEEHGYAVRVARDGIAAMLTFRESTPDLIVLDLNLPRKDGFTVCREIRAENQTVPILMLTAYSGTEDKIKGFDAGTDQYLEKPFAFNELLTRIKSLLRRSAPAPREMRLRVADLEMNVSTREVHRAGQPIKLTPREYSLLEYFMRNPNRVLTRSEIALNVWKIDFNTQTNITDVYVNFLRRKIDKAFPSPLLHTYSGVGYAISDSSFPAASA